jgi:hypothetical protein
MNLPVSRCYPLEKIVSDDSWHIPGFLSTLSNCWTQKFLVAERLNGYSRVCFSQASWIYPDMCIAYSITSSVAPLDIIYKHFSSSYFMS